MNFGPLALAILLATTALAVPASADHHIREPVWSAILADPAGRDEGRFGTYLAADPLGDLVFSGASVGVHDFDDVEIAAYAQSSGELRWLGVYGAPEQPDKLLDLRSSPDGQAVFAAGARFSDESLDWDFVLYRVDAATGAVQWEQVRDGWGEDDTPVRLAVDPTGERVFVTGDAVTAVEPYGFRDTLTLAYDAESGEELWASRAGRVKWDDPPHALTVDEAGTRVLVSIETDFGYRRDMVTIAYDATTGRELWRQIFDRDRKGGYPPIEYPIDSTVDADSVYVTGRALSRFGDYDIATVAYDLSSGAERWRHIYTVRNFSDLPRTVLVDPNLSSVFVVGYTRGRDGWPDILVFALDSSSGKPLWERKVGGPSSDYVSTSGNSSAVYGMANRAVFVAGTFGRGLESLFGALAVDAVSGRVEWKATYDDATGIGDDGENAALSPDEARLFVNGDVEHEPGNDIDLVTLAYATA